MQFKIRSCDFGKEKVSLKPSLLEADAQLPKHLLVNFLNICYFKKCLLISGTWTDDIFEVACSYNLTVVVNIDRNLS